MPKSQPTGSNPSLEAQIPAWGLKSKPGGSNPSLEAQIRPKLTPWFEFPIFSVSPSLPQITDLTHESQTYGLNSNQSIGHRPLWGRCPSYYHHFHQRQLQRCNGNRCPTNAFATLLFVFSDFSAPFFPFFRCADASLYVRPSVCRSVCDAFVKTANTGKNWQESLLSPWDSLKLRFRKCQSIDQSLTHLQARAHFWPVLPLVFFFFPPFSFYFLLAFFSFSVFFFFQ